MSSVTEKKGETNALYFDPDSVKKFKNTTIDQVVTATAELSRKNLSAAAEYSANVAIDSSKKAVVYTAGEWAGKTLDLSAPISKAALKPAIEKAGEASIKWAETDGKQKSKDITDTSIDSSASLFS